MNWTKEAPAATGWYWWRQDEHDEEEVGLFSAEHGTISFPDDGELYTPKRLMGEWLGPITSKSLAAALEEVERLKGNYRKGYAAGVVDQQTAQRCGYVFAPGQEADKIHNYIEDLESRLAAAEKERDFHKAESARDQHNAAVSQEEASRLLDRAGSEYRRGMERAAEIADEHNLQDDDGQIIMFGAEIGDAIRAEAKTEGEEGEGA